MHKSSIKIKDSGTPALVLLCTHVHTYAYTQHSHFVELTDILASLCIWYDSTHTSFVQVPVDATSLWLLVNVKH